MNSNRRNFIKNTLFGAGVISSGLVACVPTTQEDKKSKDILKNRTPRFNMCGYAAPKLDKVRIGFIGLGSRGTGAVERYTHLDGVEIVALCDVFEDRVEKCQKMLKSHGLSRAKSYSGTKEIWKSVCESPEIDLIYTCTPWDMHAPIAVYAMQCGKHAATEVPAAKTLDECWQLVETSESTKRHCMMLENCCYDFFELLTLNMARQGYFGEIVHVEGAYIHELRESLFSKEDYTEMWRLKENMRNGNLYPTHGLGPVCQVLNINRGDRMEYLTSTQSADFQLGNTADSLAASDPFYREFSGKKYRGNMNITTIRTVKGKTIMVQHDVTSPRPYSRIHLISGTEGMAQKWPGPKEWVAKGHEWLGDEEIAALHEKYTPEIIKHVGDMARKVGGHGGMDFMMDWRLIDCLRNGLPLDQDVYDAALWSSIAPLSEISVANRSNSVDVPDFTCGSWKTNTQVELTLKGGGTTGTRNPGSANAISQLNI